ncbi:hypothetical protein CPT03_02305 [Pedobacter ginsengisoli]|uniref:Uncharacterized protein n=1 Tax=Pedobacter ginsengisoli TaxID=363852 RepID=A0A2D1U179_9SPHI|nr:hypothetical protein [Pedobacter ginsengisoli]ATP55378.1 hypothetical protein CPT03_02305 [Pedobacter ginsengisoli]
MKKLKLSKYFGQLKKQDIENLSIDEMKNFFGGDDFGFYLGSPGSPTMASGCGTCTQDTCPPPPQWSVSTE